LGNLSFAGLFFGPRQQLLPDLFTKKTSGGASIFSALTYSSICSGIWRCWHRGRDKGSLTASAAYGNFFHNMKILFKCSTKKPSRHKPILTAHFENRSIQKFGASPHSSVPLLIFRF
jgi:hypothetical protein